MSQKTIIIGGGLTGLVTAFYLKKSGKDFLLLEKEDRTGGVIETVSENGFTYEKGPNTGVIGHPEVSTLFEDLAGYCIHEIANPQAKKRLIWKNGRWEAIPSGLVSAVRTPLFSLSDKFRILGEPFRKPGSDPDESLADLVRRRMGKSFLDYAVDPFIKGVYAGDPEYIITRYALPKLYRLEQEYGSFIGGSVKKKFRERNTGQKKASREVFSMEGGLGKLVEGLALAIGQEHIVTSCGEIGIEPGKGYFRIGFTKDGMIKEESCERLITTTGAHALPKILEFLGKPLLHDLSNLRYARVAELAIGFKEWKGIKLDAFGGLVPSAEKRRVLGILFPSAFLKNRAPEGGALLTCFTGGISSDYLLGLDDESLLRIVEEEVSRMMGLKVFHPDLLKLFRYQHAIPQYGINTGKRLEAIQKAEKKFPGLQIGGNLKDGIGMADRIRQGKMLAGCL